MRSLLASNRVPTKKRAVFAKNFHSYSIAKLHNFHNVPLHCMCFSIFFCKSSESCASLTSYLSSPYDYNRFLMLFFSLYLLYCYPKDVNTEERKVLWQNPYKNCSIFGISFKRYINCDVTLLKCVQKRKDKIL